MSRDHVLFYGAQIRENVLAVYRQYPRHDADAIVRRMAFEIGEAVSDRFSRKDAGQILYAAADACTAKLPVEDFRLPIVSESVPANAAPPKSELKKDKSWAELSWSGKLGRIFGKVFGEAISFWLGMVTGFFIARHQ